MKELFRETLTNLPQTPYSKGVPRFNRGKGIFMLEPGQGDSIPQEPQGVIRPKAEIKKEPQGILKAGSAESVKKAQDAWTKYNEGKKLSLEEQVRQRLLRAFGKGPNDPIDPELQKYIQYYLLRGKPPFVTEEGRALPEIAGAQDVLDTTGVTDQTLLGIMSRFNRREGGGLVDRDEIDRTVRDLEQRLLDPIVPQDQKDRAQQAVSALEQQLIDAKERQEEARRQETSPHTQVTLERVGLVGYTVKDLVTRREIRDEAFNNLFAGVDSTPHEFFQTAFNPLTYGYRYESFMELVREASIGRLEGFDRITEGMNSRQIEDLQKGLADDYLRYQTERRVRQNLHDVNAALFVPSLNAEQIFDHMQQFGSELGDVALKTPGVKHMMDLYEQAIRQSLAENNGFLKPEAIWGTIEKDDQGRPVPKRGAIEERTKVRFMELNKQGKIMVKDESGRPRVLEDLKSWEVDRVFAMARGMMIASERLISLAAESKLPEGSYSSVFLQDVVQSYAAYIHLIGKFGLSEKDIAAYLYKREEIQGPLDFFRRWNSATLKDALARFEKDPAAFLNDPNIEKGDDLRYLMLRNPNRAGDIFTWLSWRAQDRLDAVSMSQDFLIAGKARMEARLRRGVRRPEGVSEEDYKNEYANWLGTALRLERLRTNLSITDEELNKFKSQGDTAKVEEIGKHQKIAREKIIPRMVDLQPHRLYLASKDVRQRVDAILQTNEGFQNLKRQMIAQGIREEDVVRTVLDNLSLVENRLLQSREELLDRGLTFDTVSLGEFYNAIEVRDAQGQIDTNKTEIQRNIARVFAGAVRRDFDDNRQNYFDEFASYKREYKHGFVLWSGDAPVDEFNMSALGPTAGFARRARDNKIQAEAIKEEIKLLLNLKNMKRADHVIAQLAVIYEKIAMYDAGKAKQGIFEKAEGVAKFFAADFYTNVPGLGMLMKQTGYASFAQIVYDDKTAGVWEAQEVNYFFTRLKQKNLITREQYEVLKRKVFAGKPDVAIDVGSTMTQFVAVALTLYLIEKLLKEK